MKNDNVIYSQKRQSLRKFRHSYQSVQAEQSLMVHADTRTKFLSSSHCMKLQWLLLLGPHTQ